MATTLFTSMPVMAEKVVSDLDKGHWLDKVKYAYRLGSADLELEFEFLSVF